MTGFRLEVKTHSRTGGRTNMVAAAAYRSGGRLSERENDTLAAAAYRSGSALGEHDFTHKRGVLGSEIHLPDHAPLRFRDRATLWREVEASERRKDARLAREAIISIPRQLTREQGIDAVRGWVSEQCVARGMCADVSYHEVKARDGGRNLHAHVMTTTREVSPEGFGPKQRAWDRRELVQEWRESWADHVNWQLARAGCQERVDHRSLAAQRDEALERGDLAKLAKVDREPQPKLGRFATRLERQGEPSRRGEKVRDVGERNAARRGLYDRLEVGAESTRQAYLTQRREIGDVIERSQDWKARAPWVHLHSGGDRFMHRVIGELERGGPAPGSSAAERALNRDIDRALRRTIERGFGRDRGD